MPKLFLEIDEKTKKELIIKCAEKGKTIKEAVTELVKKWVKK